MLSGLKNTPLFIWATIGLYDAYNKLSNFVKYEKTISKSINDIISEIGVNGYSIAENIIPEDICNQLLVAHKKFGDITDTYYKNDRRTWGVHNISPAHNEYLKYLDDEVKVKYIGEKYCSSKICLSTLLAGRLGHNDESSTGSGGGWHRDSYSQQFKSILYLTNVTERNGPFQYIKKSHLRSNIRKILTMRALDHEGGRITRYTEADIDLILSKFDYTIKTCTGGIGTLIFADTRGIHRGYPIENGERFSLTTYYTPKRVGVSDEILALNDHTIKKFRNSKFMNNSNHL